jgi:predicted RNA-binding protein with PIN domain
LREILLVDGYNIIHAWSELKRIAQDSLEDARHALVEIMQDFQGYLGYRIIIVFDAHMIQGGLEKKEIFGGVEVVYTKENETADRYIERMVDGIPKNVRVMVATSDYLQQTIVMSRGAVRISARELMEQVKHYRKSLVKEYLEKPEPKSNTLEDWAEPEVAKILNRWRKQS